MPQLRGILLFIYFVCTSKMLALAMRVISARARVVQFHWNRYEPAKIDYWNNIEYLEREWTLNEVYNFMDKVDQLIDLLTKENLTFKPTVYKNTFQVPVIKQITLYYRFENNAIELLRFGNNYQDLKKFSL